MSTWESQFRDRLRSFESTAGGAGGGAVSIKVRVTRGCFHREHSPEAYAVIDEYLASLPQRDFAFEEHESGPEIILLITVAVGLTREVVGLVAEIIKARHKGVERGDRPSEPVEVIVRRMDERGTLREETVVRIGHGESFNASELERAVHELEPPDAGE